jgi:hypothetical protein
MAWLLVSLASVKQALRVDHTTDDAMLELLISAASRRVVRHLKGQAGELLTIDSPPDSPPNDLTSVDEDVQAAVIILTGIMYRNTDNDVEKAFMDGELPWPVRALLKPLRDPTLA